MATRKRKPIKQPKRLNYIIAIVVCLSVIIIAGLIVTTPARTGFASKEDPPNTITTPFPIHALGGYEGWADCQSQDGGIEKADLYCKCHGYTGVADGKSCYHKKSSSGFRISTEGQECDFLKAGTNVASGLGGTKITCSEICSVPDEGKHIFEASLITELTSLKLWDNVNLKYSITNKAVNKEYNYRIELWTTGIKRAGAPTAGIAKYSYDLLLNGVTKQNVEHRNVKKDKTGEGTFSLIYTDQTKPKSAKINLYVQNIKSDCWAKVTELALK